MFLVPRVRGLSEGGVHMNRTTKGLQSTGTSDMPDGIIVLIVICAILCAIAIAIAIAFSVSVARLHKRKRREQNAELTLSQNYMTTEPSGFVGPCNDEFQPSSGIGESAPVLHRSQSMDALRSSDVAKQLMKTVYGSRFEETSHQQSANEAARPEDNQEQVTVTESNSHSRYRWETASVPLEAQIERNRVPEPPQILSRKEMLDKLYHASTDQGIARPCPSAPSLNDLYNVPEAPSMNPNGLYNDGLALGWQAHHQSLPDVSYCSAFQKVNTENSFCALNLPVENAASTSGQP